MCGPALRPQAMSRDGVHSAWRAVGCRHVRGFGRVSAFPADPEVHGDPAVLVEDLDRRCAETDIDLAAGQRVGDAVEGVFDLDVVVDVDAGLAPLGVLVALGRERLERRPVQISNQLRRLPSVFWNGRSFSAASSGAMARGVRRARRTSVAQRRHDPALGLSGPQPPLRLVLRRAGPRGQHGGSVVRGQFLVVSGSGPARSGWPCAPRPSRRLGSRVPGTPPQNSNVRTWDITQSGSARLQVTSTNV